MHVSHAGSNAPPHRLATHPQLDAQLFSLAALLSTHLIFNQRGNMDDSALDLLSVVAAATSKVHLTSSGAAGTSPSLTVLVRDWALDLPAGMGPKDWLEEHVLGEGQDDPFNFNAAAGKGKKREAIKRAFTQASGQLLCELCRLIVSCLALRVA